MENDDVTTQRAQHSDSSGTRGPGKPRHGDLSVPEERVILHRGMEAFAELGYDRASARELARRLGVSHNFINDRYGSKANFWRAVVDSALAEAQRERDELVNTETEDAELLRLLITHFYARAAATPLLGRLLAEEFSRDSERLDYVYQHYVGPTMAAIQPITDRLAAAGRIPPTPPDVLYFVVFSPVSGLMRTPLAHRLGRPRPETKQDRERIAKQLAELVLSGLLRN